MFRENKKNILFGSPLVWKWGVPGQSFVAGRGCVFNGTGMYFRITTNKNTWAVDPHSFFVFPDRAVLLNADPEPD